jgi:hypothetical protein
MVSDPGRSTSGMYGRMWYRAGRRDKHSTWMMMLDLTKPSHRFYIQHGSELSPVKPIAYADDLVAIMADVSGLQQVSRVVSGFCVICNLTILPTKLRTYCQYRRDGE